jgi:hypothetical protein
MVWKGDGRGLLNKRSRHILVVLEDTPLELHTTYSVFGITDEIESGVLLNKSYKFCRPRQPARYATVARHCAARATV